MLGLRFLLTYQAGFTIVEETTTCAGVVNALQRQHVDVVLLDIRLSNGDCLQWARQVFAAAGTRTKVVIFTESLAEDETCELVRLGAKGLLLKEMSPALIIGCLRRVHDGGEWLERRSMMQAFERILRREAEFQEIEQHLSPREMDIALLVAQGCSNKAISQKLCLSEGSVRVYLTRVYAKLQIADRLQLALHFKEKGLV